jgi:putative sterol carrier protein
MVARITTSKEYFDTLQDRFIADASKGVDVQISYDLSGDGGGLWTITVKDQTLSIAEGGCEKPKVTIMMDATEYVEMVNGDLDGTRAYMTRKLKIKGSIPMAQKMKKFLPVRAKD